MKRLIVGFGLACVFALTMAATVKTQWHPWCATLNDSDPMWYVLMCFIDPPSKDGQS